MQPFFVPLTLRCVLGSLEYKAAKKVAPRRIVLEERVYSYVPGEPKVRHLSTRLTQNHSPQPSFVAPSRLRMRTGDLGLVSQTEISRVDVFSFDAYSAKLLLFACSCASSDSAFFPLR